jgi:type IV pilus assembly protein PilZ
MPFLTNGGIFVPTNKPYKIGDEIYLILTLINDPTKYPVAGKVAWITPAGANNNKAQGIGVHFSSDESGKRVKMRIEELLGAALGSTRATHTL